MNKFETYWDNFNTELYALVCQVKKCSIHTDNKSFNDYNNINLN